MRLLLIYFLLSALSLPAYSLTSEPDTLTAVQSSDGTAVERTDTVSGRDRSLPEFTVYGKNKVKRKSYVKPNTDMQLIGIRSSDMSFKPLGLLKKIIALFSKKRHKETRQERTRRILNEYDNALPVTGNK